MLIYIICPVRQQTEGQGIDIEKYVKDQESIGNNVYYPKRDAPQESKTGYEIVMSEKDAIERCDEVHVFWDINSKGSHFDLGMAVANNKPIEIIHEFVPDPNEKSYMKVIKMMNEIKN